MWKIKALKLRDLSLVLQIGQKESDCLRFYQDALGWYGKAKTTFGKNYGWGWRTTLSWWSTRHVNKEYTLPCQKHYRKGLELTHMVVSVTPTAPNWDPTKSKVTLTEAKNAWLPGQRHAPRNEQQLAIAKQKLPRHKAAPWLYTRPVAYQTREKPKNGSQHICKDEPPSFIPGPIRFPGPVVNLPWSSLPGSQKHGDDCNRL